MIEDAEKKGLLKRQIIIEATSEIPEWFVMVAAVKATD
jgi:hypothetical protein